MKFDSNDVFSKQIFDPYAKAKATTRQPLHHLFPSGVLNSLVYFVLRFHFCCLIASVILQSNHFPHAFSTSWRSEPVPGKSKRFFARKNTVAKIFIFIRL